MGALDFVVISVIAIALLSAIMWIVRNKKQGKSGCGCSCAGNCFEKPCNETRALEHGKRNFY
jgi:hypothetical protein